MNDVVDIDELAGSGKKVKPSVVDVKGLSVSAEGSSRVPIHVPNAPPAPQTGGKYTPLAAPPGTLEWGCTPTVLFNWFRSWDEFWEVN